jgi:hypothetical protein
LLDRLLGTFSSRESLIHLAAKNPTFTGFLNDSRRLVINHCSNAGDEWDVFSISEAKIILDYLFSTYFQHYKLYYAFMNKPQTAETLQVSRQVLEPIQLKPLSESLTLEAYKEQEMDSKLRVSEEFISEGEEEDTEEGGPQGISQIHLTRRRKQSV